MTIFVWQSQNILLSEKFSQATQPRSFTETYSTLMYNFCSHGTKRFISKVLLGKNQKGADRPFFYS